MLRANVGLSRKVSRDYQSTGYSVNLDGEIPFAADDADAVLAKVKELYDLAQEAINREIDRDESEAAIGRRDEEPTQPTTPKNGAANHQQSLAHPRNPSSQSQATQNKAPRNGNGSTNGNADAATNKQVQFILTMSKRFKLSNPQLENRIAQIIGRKCGVYDLTKKEAGLVLDQFTNGGNGQ